MVLVFTAFLEERGSIAKLCIFRLLFFKYGFPYISCNNCAVRNPAGTRLDSSSLVNKQVAKICLTQTLLNTKIVYRHGNKSSNRRCFNLNDSNLKFL